MSVESLQSSPFVKANRLMGKNAAVTGSLRPKRNMGYAAANKTAARFP